MRSMEEIRRSYHFSAEEFALLNSLAPVVESQMDLLLPDFYQYLAELPDAGRFLQDENRRQRLLEHHRNWLHGVFRGPYDERHFRRLQSIGQTHVRIGLSAHFVYVAMNYLRSRLQRLIAEEVEPERQAAAQEALNKALDLNLDIIARTYHDEEMRRVALSRQLDDFLIRFARRFTLGLDFLLVFGLILLSVGTVAMLINDITLVFRLSPEKGLVATLGSLLILWLMIELLEAQIDRVKGGRFRLSLFIGVALIAFIRKILVATVAQEPLTTEAFYLAGILVLGGMFWLVSRAEQVRK